MAIMKGNDIIGLVGPIVIKHGKNGKKVVQTRPRQYTQHKESKRTSKMFGFGSSVACLIRRQLSSTIGSMHDSGMVNRFNTPIKEVLIHCFNEKDGIFNFEEDSFSRLAEFEFNIKSPLINFLWVKPTLTLDGNTLKVTIPEFKIPSQFTFPKRTNTCEISITISQLNLNQASKKHELYYSFEINANQQSNPAKEIVFEVANECLCVAAIGLDYSQRDNNISTMYNSKLFNPANVVGALIIPGVYVEPPAPPVSNIAYSKEWTLEAKLKF